MARIQRPLFSLIFLWLLLQSSQILSSSPHQSLSSGSNPPTPPTRRHSLRSNGASGSQHHPGETFESRFANMFKTPQYLPPPEPFTQCAKTYPSRSNQCKFDYELTTTTVVGNCTSTQKRLRRKNLSEGGNRRMILTENTNVAVGQLIDIWLRNRSCCVLLFFVCRFLILIP